MRCRCTPRILLAINDRHARVAKVQASMLVDGLDIGCLGDVELGNTINGSVFKGDCARENGRDMLGNSSSARKISPSEMKQLANALVLGLSRLTACTVDIASYDHLPQDLLAHELRSNRAEKDLCNPLGVGC